VYLVGGSASIYPFTRGRGRCLSAIASKRQQTIGKRNRERAVEEKRRRKRERKQAEAAERAAALEAGLPPPEPAAERAAAREAGEKPRKAELPGAEESLS
jgi:hypothetical protein